MTKKQLVEKLRQLGGELEDLELLISNFKETFNNLRSILDDIPDDVSEITDEEEEE